MPRYAKKRTTYRKKPSYRRKPAKKAKRKAAVKLTKKIKDISAERKTDIMVSAVKPALGNDPSIKAFADFRLDGTIKCFGWTPSFHQGQDRKGPHVRNSSTPMYTGFSEKYTIGSHSGVPIIHRRIVFGVNLVLPDFALYDNDQKGERYRSLDPLTYSNWWFAGTAFADWQDAMKAPLDKNALRVIYDKKRMIYPRNDYGTEVARTHWIPYKRKIHFADKENKDATVWEGWPSANTEKVYIIDLLQSSTDTSNDAGGVKVATFESNVTHYWREN